MAKLPGSRVGIALMRVLWNALARAISHTPELRHRVGTRLARADPSRPASRLFRQLVIEALRSAQRLARCEHAAWWRGGLRGRRSLVSLSVASTSVMSVSALVRVLLQSGEAPSRMHEMLGTDATLDTDGPWPASGRFAIAMSWTEMSPVYSLPIGLPASPIET